MTTSLDLLVLGNAIVDVIARADDAFLAEQGVAKGAMQLIDEARAETLFQRHGAGGRSCRGAPAPTRRSARPCSAPGPASSARSGTTRSAACSATT